MWTVQIDTLPDRRGLRGEVRVDGHAASVDSVCRGWEQDADLRSAFVDALASAPYEAFRWETPAVTLATLDRPFEFVVLEDRSLARPPDTRAFAEYFVDEDVVDFVNLGGDATLVVPCPRGPAEVYVHLAAFLRGAPPTQRDALWRAVGAAMRDRVDTEPVWLSTAGGGVAWVHVRLDDRPKYYAHAPYRRRPS
jgi:hypothetical protein